MAKGRSKISATIIWINNKDRKLLSQLLKNPLVVRFNKHKKAKGESRIKTFVKIYLKVKCKTRVKDEKESILDKIPSIEKILKFLDVSWFSNSKNDEKEIVLLKRWFPKPQINSEIS